MDQIDRLSAGEFGSSQEKLLRGVAAEIGEGVEELLSCRLRAGVGGAYLEVFLYEGGGRDGGRRLWVCDEAKTQNVDDNDDDSGGGEHGPGIAALAEADAKEPEGVDRRNDEGDSVGSRDGRQVNQHRIVHLGDAEKIPGKTGDAGSGEFYGHPREGYEEQSELATEA